MTAPVNVAEGRALLVEHGTGSWEMDSWLRNNAAALLDAAEREQAVARDANAAIKRLQDENDRLRAAQGDRWDSPEGRTNYDVAHAVALKDAERAVVEAAKAWSDSVHDEIADRLAAAVDALRKVEQR